MAGPWALPVQILYRPGFTSRTGGAPREIVFATVTGTRRHPVRTGWRASGPRNSSSCWDIAVSTYEMNVSLLIQIACLGALALLGLCVAPGFAATISRSSEIEASLAAIWSMIVRTKRAFTSGTSGTRRSSVHSG